MVTDVTPQLGCLHAATLFHNTLLHRVLHAPAEFFDTTPCGRILARFSKDIEVVDSDLPQLVSDSVYITFEVNVYRKNEFYKKKYRLKRFVCVHRRVFEGTEHLVAKIYFY